MGFDHTPSSEQDAPPIKLAVPGKAVNALHLELMERMTLDDIGASPMVFVDNETGELEAPDDFAAAFGRPFTLSEALALDGLIGERVRSKHRMAIIIATEQGPTRLDGGPTLAEFRAACALENVNPIL
ncbi:MAG TPA: hypothetical protein VMV59_07015 [Candidatus Dormibacteraeota bacterium]|nr:hypothetical protein [Candidatus Dormibacteraeota bacterium]